MVTLPNGMLEIRGIVINKECIKIAINKSPPCILTYKHVHQASILTLKIKQQIQFLIVSNG